MEHCLTSRRNDCKNCYKCIRHCPTKSISFINNQASIIFDECVLCGHCFINCPQQTKVIRNDVDKVKELISKQKKVYVSLAPSFVANYPLSSINTMRIALKKLGFYDVEETAIGATIVKKTYDEMCEKHLKDIIISSCCHSVNLLIQKHYPKCLPYLADVLSPMLAHARDIKERDKDAYVVFIGPCIAKKDEADKNDKYVDAALTYLELTRWLKETNIEIEAEQDTRLIEESKARLFPTSGGILKSMECKANDYQYIVVDGMDNVINALKNIEENKIHNCFIEMSACNGSCINGPAIDSENHKYIEALLNVNRSAGKKDFNTKLYTYKDIQKSFYEINIPHNNPSETEIIEVLQEMGKTDKGKELNCGSCGYNTCRDKAKAILAGKAIKEMCLPYLMEKAQSFSDNIINNTPNGLMVLDESLNVQLMNKAMCSILLIPNNLIAIGKNVTTILSPENYAEALCGNISSRKKKQYLAEYNKYVEETIVYDPKFHIIISIMRDITEQEIKAQERDELVRKSMAIANKVIDKNMRSVQEIASLLGETAAETKVALSSLKDTFKDDSK